MEVKSINIKVKGNLRNKAQPFDKNGNAIAYPTLIHMAKTPIKRHIKIRSQANPFDPSWDAYFESRRRSSNSYHAAGSSSEGL